MYSIPPFEPVYSLVPVCSSVGNGVYSVIQFHYSTTVQIYFFTFFIRIVSPFSCCSHSFLHLKLIFTHSSPISIHCPSLSFRLLISFISCVQHRKNSNYSLSHGKTDAEWEEGDSAITMRENMIIKWKFTCLLVSVCVWWQAWGIISSAFTFRHSKHGWTSLCSIIR